MALETVVFPQEPFGYTNTRELHNLLGGNNNNNNWPCFEFGLEKFDELGEEKLVIECFGNLENQITDQNCVHGEWNNANLSRPPPPPHPVMVPRPEELPTTTMMTDRPKRRRTRSRKNKEDIENQRMTHIAVERNRRKQMNEYLSVLRSLMPESYVQRGDQASIIGGAINFVKELEQQLQILGARKDMEAENGAPGSYSEFTNFPRFSQGSSQSKSAVTMNETMVQKKSAIADIEVTMVESHANLRIRSKRRPKQLLKLVSGVHDLRLTILHLNVTTIDQLVLYSLSVKVEDDCKLLAVDDISSAVYQIFVRIEDESL